MINRKLFLQLRSAAIIFLVVSLLAAGCSSSAAQAEVEKQLAVTQLTLNDLPVGYQQLTDTNLRDIGITRDKLTQAVKVSFTDAHLLNFNAFINPDANNVSILFSMLFYPLSEEDIRKWNEHIKNPEKSAQALAAGMGEGSAVTPKPEYAGIGESSQGFSSTMGKFKVEILLARRKTTAFLVMLLYLDSATTDVRQLGVTLDGRVSAAYQKPPQ